MHALTHSVPAAQLIATDKNMTNPELQLVWDSDPLCNHGYTRIRSGMVRVTCDVRDALKLTACHQARVAARVLSLSRALQPAKHACARAHRSTCA